jgi:acetyl/propionyl-CoA carboxylase alpha subunit/acetyl-CoA carboxylase carboxyltransferase component
MQREFQRVAIVNRGEAAMRFIHAAHEFNQEHGTRLSTIALYTEPDRHAMFVRQADEAVSLGPAQIIDPGTRQSKCSYVDYGRLGRALALARADAVWVGWGFVAEHAAFADLCRELGIVFIGPNGDVMRLLGDKIISKLLAEQAGLPVVPWSGGPVATPEAAVRHAERLGYPLLIKATAGGGGHGIRRVDSEKGLLKAFESARTEAFKAFGDSTVFMEKLLERARHVEVQIIADDYGTTWAAGVRDCSIQRRHQKILEEAPSPVLSVEQDRALRGMAVRLSETAGYHNAGTVEFLYAPDTEQFWFMEMNTRLQVEHPVTECTTGLDIVKLQIHVARGGRLEGEPPLPRGHSIEVRLNAEDPDNGFAPAPGSIERFRIPAGPGVRIDTGVTEGDAVPSEFDSMIAKIIAWGSNRDEALSRLRRALGGSVIVLRGGACNKAFLLELLNRDEVKRGAADIEWLDRLAANGEHVSRRYAEIALVQAAIEVYGADLAVEQAQFYVSAVRGRPEVRREVGRSTQLRYRGQSYQLKVNRLSPKQYRVDVDGSQVDAEVDRIGQFEYWLTAFGRRFQVISVVEGLSHRIEVDGFAHRVERDDNGVVRSPAPAVVVSIAVKAGDQVSTGQPVAVLEAMKMEMKVAAPCNGRVRVVMTIPNVQVATGAPLLQIEPASDEEAPTDSKRVSFRNATVNEAKVRGIDSQCLRNLDVLRQLMLGFDVDPAHTARLVSEWRQHCELGAASDEIREREDEILNIFVDICSLFHRLPEVSELNGRQVPSAETSLFSYLRILDSRGDGLPPAFIEALKRALAHYGIASLDRSPELEECLLWIYKSHVRVEQQIGPVVGLLASRLKKAGEIAGAAGDSFCTLLDRLVSVTREQFPAVSDLAREVRYRYFDQPMFEQARKHVYEQVEEHLACLASRPNSPDWQERVKALIECPQSLVGEFSRRFATATPAMRQLMLEVLTSRLYRIRQLTGFEYVSAGEHNYVTTEYDYEGARIHVFTTHAEHSQFGDAAEAMFPEISRVPEDHDLVIDFFVWRTDLPGDFESVQRETAEMLNRVAFPRRMRRIVIAVAGPGQPSQSFTYRPCDQGYVEEKLYRGLHPMLAKRLHFWRLANFNIERLPSAEDIYLLRGVAKNNPKDERLFAFAEVRDLTPVCDESGRVVELPHLERMFTEALAGIRLQQSLRTTRDRLHWNRILLNVWPPLSLQPDELNHLVQKLAPAADGLGLEQVIVRARIPSPKTGELRDMVVRISNPAGAGTLITFRPATANLRPIKTLTEYNQKVVRMRQRGMAYPYEIIRMMTPPREHARADMPSGDFVEYDLDQDGRLSPVYRAYGENKSNIIAGVIRNFTSKYPEGMTRVLLLGDPSRDLGALAESECRRIIAALDLAESMGVPLEWFPISAGAKISMDSGVENMDWIAAVLRRLVEFTQAGGEVNLVVDGINVGAQPYWNAEATMLMHTRGILVMTPKAAMVLTGKRALDYSGSVSAEDNQGIGGYDRIMGVNGQAQYWARDLYEACQILLRHYDHTYVVPGERFPRKAATTDPADRDVRFYPHNCVDGDGFNLVGEVFSDETNNGRKKSFDIRSVMLAVKDQDHPHLERWAAMIAAETAVVWDAHLGGFPVCLIGIESRPLPRLGFVPADGPDQWTAGTLFPLSSKKVARAINAASNNRPVVLLANLSGFDGSPESMRKLVLEYGAEIGRSVVNFKGPMVFCVISRYHGGAYVVFSRVLNENLTVAALEGSYASVIGGAPAAAVVFASEVEGRTRKDPRLVGLNERMMQAEGAEKGRLRTQWNDMFKLVHSEKLGEVADEFDAVHSIHRAMKVGALHQIISPSNLRSYLIRAIGRGVEEYAMARSGRVRMQAAAASAESIVYDHEH